jgi:5-methyltetrahydropteroyltriglutamate--homocysteine methyltransferase
LHAPTPQTSSPIFRHKVTFRSAVLEYATERAGDLVRFDGKELGLGVVNPRTATVESSDDIRRAIERALRHYEPEQLFLNPACGFGTFSNRPMNSDSIAMSKLLAMADVARALRGERHATLTPK